MRRLTFGRSGILYETRSLARYRVWPYLAVVILLFGCATHPVGERIDNLPMYGQPSVPRPDFLKRADDEFIAAVLTKFKDRKTASDVWAAAAEEFLNKGNLDFAMRRYNQSWLLNPNNYKPFWGFGRVMLERSKIDESIAHFETAIRLVDDPFQKVALLSDAGVAYAHKAKSIGTDKPGERDQYFKRANQLYAESTTLDPKYTNSWRNWAMSLYWEGRYADSWNKVKAARVADPYAVPAAFISDLSQKMPEPK